MPRRSPERKGVPLPSRSRSDPGLIKYASRIALAPRADVSVPARFSASGEDGVCGRDAVPLPFPDGAEFAEGEEEDSICARRCLTTER